MAMRAWFVVAVAWLSMVVPALAQFKQGEPDGAKIGENQGLAVAGRDDRDGHRRTVRGDGRLRAGAHRLARTTSHDRCRRRSRPRPRLPTRSSTAG